MPQVGWGEEKEGGVTSGGSQASLRDSELGRPGQTSAPAQGCLRLKSPVNGY